MAAAIRQKLKKPKSSQPRGSRLCPVGRGKAFRSFSPPTFSTASRGHQEGHQGTRGKNALARCATRLSRPCASGWSRYADHLTDAELAILQKLRTNDAIK